MTFTDFNVGLYFYTESPDHVPRLQPCPIQNLPSVSARQNNFFGESIFRNKTQSKRHDRPTTHPSCRPSSLSPPPKRNERDQFLNLSPQRNVSRPQKVPKILNPSENLEKKETSLSQAAKTRVMMDPETFLMMTRRQSPVHLQKKAKQQQSGVCASQNATSKISGRKSTKSGLTLRKSTEI